MKPYRAEVEWVDTCSHSGWQDPDFVLSEAAPVRVASMGYVVKKDKDAIVLVQTIGPQMMAEAMAIPMAIVKRVRRLK